MRIPFLYLLCVGSVHSKSFILNYNLKSCRNCVHYQPSSYNEFESSYNKCNLFGKKDIVTNKVTYDYVDSCRMDDSKCGMHAKYFEEEPNIEFKIMKHQLIKNAPYTLLLSFLILEIIALTCKSNT